MWKTGESDRGWRRLDEEGEEEKEQKEKYL